MAKSAQLDKAAQMFKSFGDRAQSLPTIDDVRAAYEETFSFPMAEDVVCERVGANGVAAEWISASGVAEDRVLFHLHGGGYAVGSMRTHREMLSRMSRASGARVLGIDYRLAPEVTFPAPVEDSIAAYRWLLSNGIDPKKIVIAGDSAGGGLVVSALVALRYLGEPMPAAGICISPWVDMEALGESYITKAEEDPVGSRDMIHFMAGMYLGSSDPRAPLASPIYADLTGLPPLLVQVGSAEVLLDDSTGLVERAKAAGVDVTLEVWDDMIHVWQFFAPILPEGQQAIDRIGEFFREHTG